MVVEQFRQSKAVERHVLFKSKSHSEIQQTCSSSGTASFTVKRLVFTGKLFFSEDSSLKIANSRVNLTNRSKSGEGRHLQVSN